MRAKKDTTQPPFPAWLIPVGNGSRIRLYTQPGASRSEIVGPYGDCLKVRIAAPPVDGAANKEISRFFARVFRTAKSSVILERGQSSRSKLIFVPVFPDKVMETLE